MRAVFRPVGKSRVAEEIVQQLRGLILSGQYAVGQKLPPERKLSEELGVNRASLREAIKSLEQLGLVKTRQGDGTRVLDFMQTAGVELVSHLIAGPTPNLQMLVDVMEFRRFFGRESARLAAERATPEDIAKLDEMAERAAEPTVDVTLLLQLDFEFYVLLAAAGHNRVMQLLINTIRAAVASYGPFFAQFHAQAPAVRKHHRDLLKAIGDKDGDAAAKVADAFLRKAVDQMAALLRTTAP